MSGSRGQSFDVDHCAVRGRTLKVSWETSAGDYDAAKLRGIFESFGIVEDVVIRSENKLRAVHNMSREKRNPLFVVPLEYIRIDNVLGADFQNYKAFGMELQKNRDLCGVL